MNISKIILENFRAYYDSIEILLNDFNVFIGKNDVGKSSILEAIDIFLNDGKGVVKVSPDDLDILARRDSVDSFKIGIVFNGFPERIIIDETNATNLKDEYLLNDNNKLEVWKTFKDGKLKGTAIKCNHPANNEFLKSLMNKKHNDLKDFVETHNIKVDDKRSSADLRKAIREYYRKKDGELKLEILEISIDQEELKNIWNKLKNYLPVFGLFHSDRKNVDQDDEIQDPLKLKIEEIFKREEVLKVLSNIEKQIKEEIENIAEKTVNKFKELSTESASIKPNIPDVNSLKWKDVYKGLGFYTDNDIPLNKRGSGFRRLVLLSSFLAEVEKNETENNNTHIIYAIEEPETALHPDLQIKLINTLKELSKKERYQILLTTHSPALIRLCETDDIRFVKQEDGQAKVQNFDEKISDEIIKTMGLLPNISKIVICVEGTNDEKFLLNINQNIDELKKIIDLKAKKESGSIAIIPMNGSNLKDWIDRYALKNTNALEFHLYDKDEDEKYKSEIEEVNKRNDGSYGVLTSFREIENYVDKEILENEFHINIEIKPYVNWGELDIPNVVKSKLRNHRDEKSIKEEICGSCSKLMTKDKFEQLGVWEEVKGWFEKINEMEKKILERNKHDNE
ncbi:MAG: ATP-dependent endonuclease of the family-like protein [Defluviitaleaceae bacterium]|nr:ATP-dependent endonuclease of the family-like protein [Defluviitaleaceae bacterium]